MDTFISFVRFFLAAMKKALRVTFVLLLLAILYVQLSKLQNPDLAVILQKVAIIGAWIAAAIYPIWCFMIEPINALVLLAIALPLYNYTHKYNDDVSSKVGALKVAALELIRMMETTTDGTEGKADKLNKIVQQFAVDGPATIAKAFCGPAKPVDEDEKCCPPFQQVSVPNDLTQMGEKLMERRAGDMATFGGNCGNLRIGLMVFILLMEHESVSGAFAHMTEYMKKQRDDTKKAIPNFVDLKRFFGLPTTWPKDNEPEEAYSKGLSWYQYLVFEAALSEKNREKVFAVMKYHPQASTPEGKKPITISGKNVLKAMRIYLYNWKIYDESIADPQPEATTD